MQILHIIPRIVPSPEGVIVGGSVNAMFNLIQKTDHKYSSKIYTQTDAGMKPKFDNVKYDITVDENPMKAGSFFYAAYFFISSLWKIVINKAWGTDIIHGHSGFAPYALLTVAAGKILRKPTIHSLYCPVYLNENNYLWSAIQKITYRFILSRADKIAAMSENIKNSLLTLGLPAEKIDVIRTCINIDVFTPQKRNKAYFRNKGIKESDKVILFVGNLKRSKGLDLLLDALALLANAGVDFRFIFTLELKEEGHEERHANIMKKIVAGGIAGRTLELGIIDSMPELMASVDLMVFPFRDTNGPSDYPMALLESMASGIPTIGARVGGIPELIENDRTGMLVDPENVVQLADAIGKLLGDQALREKMGKNAREVFLRRSEANSEMIKPIEDIYKKIIKENKRAELRATNSKLFYEKDAQKYDLERWKTPAGKYINEAQASILTGMLGELNGNNFLEIAAGTGRFTKVLLDRDKRVTTIDISSAMTEELKINLCGHRNYKDLQIMVGDARNTGLNPLTYDAVFCFNAFSHIPEHEKVIKEAAKVLKQKGSFIFNIPNYISLYFPFGLYINTRSKALNKDVYTRWYSYREIKKNLEAEGFIIKMITGHLHFPTKTPAILLPIFKVLDRWMRKGPLAIFAPILFIEAQKVNR